jgi:uncharacterized membrane protein
MPEKTKRYLLSIATTFLGAFLALFVMQLSDALAKWQITQALITSAIVSSAAAAGKIVLKPVQDKLYKKYILPNQK